MPHLLEEGSSILHKVPPPWDFSGVPDLAQQVVQISLSNTEGAGSIPGQGAKIPYVWGSKNQSIKQKQYCKNSGKTFKMVPIGGKKNTHTIFQKSSTSWRGQYLFILFSPVSRKFSFFNMVKTRDFTLEVLPLIMCTNIRLLKSVQHPLPGPR